MSKEIEFNGKVGRLEEGADCLFAMIRIAGACFPGAAIFLQAQAELDNKRLSKRIELLEDPISAIHDDVPVIGRLMYEALLDQGDAHLELPQECYVSYARPLYMLEAKGLIRGNHAIGQPFACGITLSDPTFILYLCVLSEQRGRMDRLYALVNSCGRGQQLDGSAVASELSLPKPVVSSVLAIFESKGLGLLCREVGRVTYIGKA